jgi:uncharacterized protein with PIN domain
MTIDDSHRERSHRFLCDAMLGSLARWLRFFGYDAVFLEPGPEDRLLAEMARSEGRWLLTRDRELASAGPRTMLIRSEGLDDQLVEVFKRLGLRPEATLDHARCGECNGDLADVSRDDVTDVAPPHVLATSPRFRRCTGCRRVYWPGSHGGRILVRMEQVVDRLDPEGSEQLQVDP